MVDITDFNADCARSSLDDVLKHLPGIVADVYNDSVVTVAGTAYTLDPLTSGKVIEFTAGTAVTVTLPNSLPVGFQVTVRQAGAGQVGFAVASGAVLRNRASQTKLNAIWAVGALAVRANSNGATAEYVLSGDTGA
jgi:hypothetical protein